MKIYKGTSLKHTIHNKRDFPLTAQMDVIKTKMAETIRTELAA